MFVLARASFVCLIFCASDSCVILFALGCQYRCNRLPGKTCLWDHSVCVEWDTEPYLLSLTHGESGWVTVVKVDDNNDKDVGAVLTDDVLDEYLMSDRVKASAQLPATAAPEATNDASQ